MATKPSPWTEYTDCPNCGNPVAVYNPRHGTGTIRVTFWHKRRDDDGWSRWCRAEIDYGSSDIRRTRYPRPPIDQEN